MTTQTTNRRIWLVDGQYLFKASPPGFMFDYRRARNWVERTGETTQRYYVQGVPDETQEGQRRFHSWLKMAPPDGPQFQVLLHPLKKEPVQCPDCGGSFHRLRQKGVDVDIVTLALTLVDRYETLVLSAGDGDFKDALEHIRNVRNKRLELVAFRGTVSADLQALADEIHWLDDGLEEISQQRRAA